MIRSGECGVTVTRPEYGISTSRVLHSSICAIRSASPIACLGVDSRANASRLIGLTSAAPLMRTWMRSASVSTVVDSQDGFSSSDTASPPHSGAFSASTSFSAIGSPKFTTTWP